MLCISDDAEGRPETYCKSGVTECIKKLNQLKFLKFTILILCLSYRRLGKYTLNCFELL
jgi:hypothetical protein